MEFIMKAIVHHRYGSPDVLQVEEIPKPTPRDGEVLVRVFASSVNAGDWHLMRASPFMVRLMSGLLTPKYKVLGADVAGRVESIGSNVKQFQPGDEVFGDLAECGFGAFAEYVCVPESALALKPTNLSFEQAAAVPAAALTALQALRNKGQVRPGQKVLINGASGGVGTFAVQIAKALGAEVTGVCSTRNMEFLRTMGADHAIDYAQDDFTKNGQLYDVIVAVNGYHSILEYKRSLGPKGVYVMTGGSGFQMFQAMALGPFLSMGGFQKMRNLLMKPNQADLLVLKSLVEAGKVFPIIDRQYSLSEVPKAIGYLEEGHAQGKVVITM
jgi:NADPH:quinone reductase-like Zn-dependent oxidoreductase